jgi:hypothetical protein
MCEADIYMIFSSLLSATRRAASIDSLEHTTATVTLFLTDTRFTQKLQYPVLPNIPLSQCGLVSPVNCLTLLHSSCEAKISLNRILKLESSSWGI